MLSNLTKLTKTLTEKNKCNRFCFILVWVWATLRFLVSIKTLSSKKNCHEINCEEKFCNMQFFYRITKFRWFSCFSELSMFINASLPNIINVYQCFNASLPNIIIWWSRYCTGTWKKNLLDTIYIFFFLKLLPIT